MGYVNQSYKKLKNRFCSFHNLVSARCWAQLLRGGGGGGSYKNPMESVTIADKHLLAEFHLIHLMNISYMPLFLVTLLDFSQVSNTWILLFAMNLSHFHFNIWCMLKGFILPSLWLNQLDYWISPFLLTDSQCGFYRCGKHKPLILISPNLDLCWVWIWCVI